MKKKLIFGIIISAVFLYLSVRKIDFVQVKEAFGTAEYIWVFPTGILILFTMWLRALRWRHLLFGMKPVDNRSLFSSVMIGFMSNNILPVRLGEIVRALSIAGKEGISRSGAFATIMIERIFDSFAILFMLGVCLIVFPFPEIIKKMGYLTFSLNLLALFMLFSLSRWPAKISGIMAVIVRIFPAKIESFLLRLMDRFIEGLGIFRARKGVLKVSVYTILIWVITALSNYFIFIAFGLYPPVVAPFVLLVVVAFAVMLPSSPGFIGTFQYGCMIALSLFEISKETSFSFSVVLWSCQYFPVTLLGLYYLRKESLSLKHVTDEKIV